MTLTPKPIATFHCFASEDEARAYRHMNGTGGWIFVQHGGGFVVLFPPQLAPAAIILHPLIKGMSGKLIGCG